MHGARRCGWPASKLPRLFSFRPPREYRRAFSCAPVLWRIKNVKLSGHNTSGKFYRQ
jgi:hypothetical protein